jgi:hypothetical protein
MREACDALGIPYAHFYGMRDADAAAFRATLSSASSWADALRGLGYSADSGSARSTIRERARAFGVDTRHLDGSAVRGSGEPWPFKGPAQPRHLRRAAAFVVAAKCALLGHDVSWPLEPTAYDLLLDTGADGILRVQVKSGTRRLNGSWTVWITRGATASSTGSRARYSSTEIDYFGVVDGDRDVYMIPVQVVEGRTALSLRCYERFRLSA